MKEHGQANGTQNGSNMRHMTTTISSSNDRIYKTKRKGKEKEKEKEAERKRKGGPVLIGKRKRGEKEVRKEAAMSKQQDTPRMT